MKTLSTLFLFLVVISCNTVNKATETENKTTIKMEIQKMEAEGYLAGQITLSTKEGDCPVTIKVEGKEGSYFLDPINLEDIYKKEGEKVWFKFGGLRMMNRCNKANPISITEIQKRAE